MQFDIAPPESLSDHSSQLTSERQTLPWDSLHKECWGWGSKEGTRRTLRRPGSTTDVQERKGQSWLTSYIGKEMSSIGHDGETVRQETCIKECKEQCQQNIIATWQTGVY
jgi:hypothetical protein